MDESWHIVEAKRDDGEAAIFRIRELDPRPALATIFVVEMPYATAEMSKLPDATAYRRFTEFENAWLSKACADLGWVFVGVRIEDGSFFLYLYGSGDPNAMIARLAPFDGALGFYDDPDPEWGEYATMRELLDQAKQMPVERSHTVRVPRVRDEDLEPKSAFGKTLSGKRPSADAASPEPNAVSRSPEPDTVSPDPKAVSPKPQTAPRSPKPNAVSRSPKPKPKAVSRLPKPTAVSRSPKPNTVSRSPKPTAVSRSPKPTAVSRSPKPTAVSRSPKPTTVSRSPRPNTVSRSPKPTAVSRSPKPSPKPRTR